MNEDGTKIDRNRLRTEHARSVYGPDLVELLHRASDATDLARQKHPPFANFVGYRSTFDIFKQSLAENWPEFAKRIASDVQFSEGLSSVLDQLDKSRSFLTDEPSAAYPITVLLQLIEDKLDAVHGKKVGHPERVPGELDSSQGKAEREVIVEHLLNSVDGLEIIKPTGHLAARGSRYGTDHWYSTFLADRVSFNIQITAFSDNEMLQFTYLICQEKFSPFEFYFPGLPQSILLGRHRNHSAFEKTENISIIVMYIREVAKNTTKRLS